MGDSGSNQTKRRVVIAAALLVAVASLVILRRFEPTDSSFFPKCVLHQWTGLHCPGCGTTRALSALAHGQLWNAMRSNPLLIVGGPIIFALIWFQRKRERSGGLASPRLCWTLFAVVVIYFIARNVPSPDRSWLAPTQAVSPVQLPTNR